VVLFRTRGLSFRWQRIGTAFVSGFHGFVLWSHLRFLLPPDPLGRRARKNARESPGALNAGQAWKQHDGNDLWDRLALWKMGF